MSHFFFFLNIYIYSAEEDTIIWLRNSLPDNTFDEVKISGFAPNDDILEQIFRTLKPNAKLSVDKAFGDRAAGQAYVSNLSLQGFVKIMAAKVVLNNNND